MSYQNPQLFYFLFAIAIPILIHLFSFQKHKTIYFSSIRFLKNIKKERHKQNHIKNLLILISRILAIIFLVMAFAKPYIPVNKKYKPTKDIFLYIDNSFSMDAENQNGNLLSQAKEKAIMICRTYNNDNNFWIITNDFLVKHNRSLNSSEIKNQINNISTTVNNKNLKQIINKKISLNTRSAHIYIISDMQSRNIEVEETIEIDSNSTLFLIPIISNVIENICIDSCWVNNHFSKDEKEVHLYAQIKNYSKKDRKDQAIFLEIDGKQKSQQYVNLKPNEQKTLKFSFLTNKNTISGVITSNDHPITFDNKFYFTLRKNKNSKIICINNNSQNTAITTLFSNDTTLYNFKNTSIKNIDFNLLKNQNLVIINEIENFSSGFIKNLNDFIKNGGSIAIFPPDNPNLEKYNKNLQSLKISTISELKVNDIEINKINIIHPIYRNVFDGKIDKINYPLVKKYFPIMSKNTSNSIPLLTQEDNQNFLEAFNIGKGTIYLFNGPLKNTYNNFSKHALFVPTLLNIASTSVVNSSLYNTINKDEYFTSSKITNTSSIIHLKNKNIDIIASQKIQLGKQLFYTNNQITESGIYNIEQDQKKIDEISYNYSNSESSSNTISISNLKKWKQKFALENIEVIIGDSNKLIKKINEVQNGKELWRIALIISLLFFLLEITLIKLLKI